MSEFRRICVIHSLPARDHCYDKESDETHVPAAGLDARVPVFGLR